ncbi:MAG TPA: hypothetical protein VHN36_01150 [Ilumatobacteraceae bacterium]|nr:hypothetical protein [Ilumatobacteraceae bacterium]
MSDSTDRRQPGTTSKARRSWVLATAAVLLSSALPAITSASVTAAATPPVDAPPVSLIGDSTMAGMQWNATSADDSRNIIANAYKLTFDAESCRRIVVTSCRGRFGSIPQSVVPLMKTTLKGKLGEALVVMAGYDDASITNAADQVVAEAETQGVVRVLWLNYRSNTNYVLPGGLAARDLYGSHNAELNAAAKRHGDLQVLDWDGFTANQPGWFASDGIHLNLAGADGLATFIKNALDAQPEIGRCRATSALTGTPDPGVSTTTLRPTDGFGFVPLVPKRVLDTRDPALGGAAGKLGTGRTVSIDVSHIVPTDAAATVLSVTATGSCFAGFLTVFACGSRPPTSNINYEVGRTTAGVAITPMTDGELCIFASAATDVVVDVMGAFTPGGDRFHPMAPTRWLDTRGAAVELAQITGPRAAPTQTQLAMRGRAGISDDATGVWLNLTVADPSVNTVLTAYPGPCGTAPLSSNVNARPQHSTASSVLVGIGDDGSVCVQTFAGSSQIVVDVAGWFGPGAGGLAYRPTAPTRLLDTRLNGGRPTRAETPVSVDGVAMLNVVAVHSAALGFVTVRPCGSPLISSLINTTPSEDTANLIAVGPDASGNVCVRSNLLSHLVVDQVATFAP